MVNTLTDSSGDTFWQSVGNLCGASTRVSQTYPISQLSTALHVESRDIIEQLCYGSDDNILGWRSAATIANGGHPPLVSTPDPNDTRIPPPLQKDPVQYIPPPQ